MFDFTIDRKMPQTPTAIDSLYETIGHVGLVRMLESYGPQGVMAQLGLYAIDASDAYVKDHETPWPEPGIITSEVEPEPGIVTESLDMIPQMDNVDDDETCGASTPSSTSQRTVRCSLILGHAGRHSTYGGFRWESGAPVVRKTPRARSSPARTRARITASP